jgi:hypothetical protein
MCAVSHISYACIDLQMEGMAVFVILKHGRKKLFTKGNVIATTLMIA